MLSYATPPADQTTLGVIGSGSRGTFVMGVFQKDPALRVGAICDVYEPNLENAVSVASKIPGTHPKVYRNYKELLADKDVQAVLIATPEHWHYQMVLDALAAGKDVYVEKPLCQTPEQGVALVEAERKSKQIIQVGMQRLENLDAAFSGATFASAPIPQITNEMARIVAPALSAGIPLMVGYARTEETLYDRPTPETLALDEAGLKLRASKRLGQDPERVIAAFRKAHPDATPWDLWILIATDHPRGTYARETARRKAAQSAAPAYLYRFDWETPEGGGHMRSPHTIEIPFVFNNIRIAGSLISKMPEAQELATKVSASWVAFARTGNPNVSGLPKWPAYSTVSRDTMLFNNTSRVEQDPDRGPRVVMEQVLKLA